MSIFRIFTGMFALVFFLGCNPAGAQMSPAPGDGLSSVASAPDNTKVYTDTRGLNNSVDFARIRSANPELNQAMPPARPAPMASGAEEMGAVPQTLVEPSAALRPDMGMQMQMHTGMEPPMGMAPVTMSPEEDLFRQYDMNGNGWISEDEFMGNKLSAFAAQIFDKLDADGNQNLDRQEFRKEVMVQQKTGGTRMPRKGEYPAALDGAADMN